MVMLDKKKTGLKSLFWSKFSHIDLTTGKKLEHSNDLKELFNSVCYKEDAIELQSFDRRVEQVRNKYK
jgi:hypothetical protein